jgi:hypothetical protein
MNDNSPAAEKSYSALATLGDICLGYAVAHVVIFYLLGTLILESLGFKVLEKLGSGVRAEQVVNMVLLGCGVAPVKPDSLSWLSGRGEIASVIASPVRDAGAFRCSPQTTSGVA